MEFDYVVRGTTFIDNWKPLLERLWVVPRRLVIRMTYKLQQFSITKKKYSVTNLEQSLVCALLCQ